MTPHSAQAGATSVPAALFVGLCRIDWIQILHRASAKQGTGPGISQVHAAGGPAANAAMTFAFLGGQATLLTGVGRDSSAGAIRADLQRAGVRLIDAAEASDSPPAMSYLRFTQGADGPEESVSSTMHASGPRLSPPPSLGALAAESQAVLVDGHHPDLAEAAARAAQERGRPCLVDGRTWTRVTPYLLPFADIVVCSAGSRPRDRRRRAPKDTLGYLLDSGASRAVITNGPRPIRWASRAHGIQPDIPVPETAVADTLGAGDVFHGALTRAITAQPAADDDTFSTALRFAAVAAAYSCQTFGTRAWMNSWPQR